MYVVCCILHGVHISMIVCVCGMCVSGYVWLVRGTEFIDEMVERKTHNQMKIRKWTTEVNLCVSSSLESRV